MSYPSMIKVRQRLYGGVVPDVAARVREELRRVELSRRIARGQRIAISAGSRGIANIASILASVVEETRALGGEPFLFSAMGSHGGGTAQGQREVLASLGITEESMKSPILVGTEVEEIGHTPEGVPVYLDQYAARADGIIVVNRVKKHTSFTSSLESGLMKMMCIGLGKLPQAKAVHGYGIRGVREVMPAVARVMLARAPILLGLAILENGYSQTADIVAIPPTEIEEQEKLLLRWTKRWLPRLPFGNIDLLIVERMGKNISGTGMDPNIIGRRAIQGGRETTQLRARTLVVLDLTEETHGNAMGIGLADLTTQRLVDKMDRKATYVNALTAGSWYGAKIPMTMPTDEEVIGAALSLLGPRGGDSARIVRIKDTLHLAELYVSEPLLAAGPPRRAGGGAQRLKVVGEPEPLRFDAAGTLVSSW